MLTAALLGVGGLLHATQLIDFTADRSSIVWYGNSQGCGRGCTLGYSFVVSSSVTLDGLGVFDADADGLDDSHHVGLWDATETLLASALVSAGAGAVGTDPSRSGTCGYAHTSIDSLTLDPSTYHVAALYEVGHTDPVVFEAVGTLSNHPGAAVHGLQFAYGGVLQLPSRAGVGHDDRYFGPAVRMTDAPEPGTLALLDLGVLGLRFVREAQLDAAVASRFQVSQRRSSSLVLLTTRPWWRSPRRSGPRAGASPAVTGPARGGTLAARRPS